MYLTMIAGVLLAGCSIPCTSDSTERILIVNDSSEPVVIAYVKFSEDGEHKDVRALELGAGEARDVEIRVKDIESPGGEDPFSGGAEACDGTPHRGGLVLVFEDVGSFLEQHTFCDSENLLELRILDPGANCPEGFSKRVAEDRGYAANRWK